MSRRFQGIGLGLCISRATVRSHGGDIIVKSKLGVGSTFYVRLPYKVQEASFSLRKEASFRQKPSVPQPPKEPTTCELTAENTSYPVADVLMAASGSQSFEPVVFGALIPQNEVATVSALGANSVVVGSTVQWNSPPRPLAEVSSIENSQIFDHLTSSHSRNFGADVVGGERRMQVMNRERHSWPFRHCSVVTTVVAKTPHFHDSCCHWHVPAPGQSSLELRSRRCRGL